jgi:2',3'-cyclic-nucleotide 2'-phosphodiesterase (5'-nucleotidase family)
MVTWVGSSAQEPQIRLAITADTEGHVAPCTHCPGVAGLGGLARRATLLARSRADLLLDAGNVFFGEDSLRSDGQVMVAAYGQLHYDAVNISFRDFRLGKSATLKLLENSPSVPLSANLLDEQTGRPLFKPFFVKQAAGRAVAVLGVTESPAGIDFLPHLKQQLAGVRIEPPAEALERWLPKAKAESTQIFLLYYGSSAGLREIRQKFPGVFAAILVGGLRPEELPEGGEVPLVATEQHGKSVAILSTGGNSPPRIEPLPVTPDIAPDHAMQQLIAKWNG